MTPRAPQLLSRFDAADMIAYTRGMVHSHINALQALADGRTACVSAERLAELERDAARYRWIRKRMDLIGTDDFREFDKDIDIAMHNDARAKEAKR